jgi:hypothetical protein
VAALLRCPVSRLTDFYRCETTDIEGRRIEEIWGWSDDELEVVHDFAQWLFPLPEPSMYNPDAPRLSREDIAIFREDPTLQANVRKSLKRILTFLGLVMTGSQVVEGPNFSERAAVVWHAPNHNWLRVTRILRSLMLLGLEKEAGALYRWLDATYASRRFPITAETFAYWAAAEEHPADG